MEMDAAGVSESEAVCPRGRSPGQRMAFLLLTRLSPSDFIWLLQYTHAETPPIGICLLLLFMFFSSEMYISEVCRIEIIEVNISRWKCLDFFFFTVFTVVSGSEGSGVYLVPSFITRVL